ncbi:MAG TPA: aldose 1-epimerase [Rhodocyclaceae bacterium]|nr:aldose 1-epimerase [Rhodocyclaceae bacterium]
MSEPTILTIQNDQQRVGLMPSLGGSPAYWDVMRDGQWQPIWRRYAKPPDLRRIVGNFALVPWSNRITGGGITVDGVFYPMAPNRADPYPIHGDGWMHTWNVTEHSEHVIEMNVESRRHMGYPYEYTATQRYSIDDNDMVMRLTVTHLGDKRLPYGLAWHPFFLRGDDPNGPRLQFKSDGYWLGTEDSIPTEHSTQLPGGWDFNQLRELGHGKIDNNFSGWDGRMIMERDDIDLRLEWETTEPAGLNTSILFRPEGLPFFCFEPITHITDAFNRPGMPGLRMLNKGEGMALEVRQTLSRL